MHTIAHNHHGSAFRYVCTAYTSAGQSQSQAKHLFEKSLGFKIELLVYICLLCQQLLLLLAILDDDLLARPAVLFVSLNYFQSGDCALFRADQGRDLAPCSDPF